MTKSRRYLHGSVYRASNKWYMRFRLPTGLESKRLIGPAWNHKGLNIPPGHYTERTARMALDAFLAKYEGWTPGSDPQFRYAADEWLEWCENDRKLRKTTLAEYQRIISRNLVPELGTKTLSQISEQDILNLRAELAGRVSASSLNQTKIVLAGVLKYAVRFRKFRGDDPSAWWDRAPIRQKLEIDVYSPAEIEALTRMIESGQHHPPLKRALSEFEVGERARTDAQDAVLIKTAAYAGLRMSEIRGLRWRDIDFAGSKISIRRAYTDAGGEDRTKSGKARTIPMAAQLAAALDSLSRRGSYTEPDDLVFCNLFGSTLEASAIYHRFVAAAEKAGLRRLRFHDLRHSAGTMFVQAFPINEVKEMLGHANIQTTMIYLHSVPRHDAADKLSALIGGSLGMAELGINEQEVLDA